MLENDYKIEEFLNLVLNEFPFLDKETVTNYWHLPILKFEFLDDIGVIAYIIVPNYEGKKEFQVAEFYLKKEFRTLKNLNKLYDLVVQLAKKNECKNILMGLHTKHKSESFFKFLSRKGFKLSTMNKEI